MIEKIYFSAFVNKSKVLCFPYRVISSMLFLVFIFLGKIIFFLSMIIYLFLTIYHIYFFTMLFLIIKICIYTVIAFRFQDSSCQLFPRIFARLPLLICALVVVLNCWIVVMLSFYCKTSIYKTPPPTLPPPSPNIKHFRNPNCSFS